MPQIAQHPRGSPEFQTEALAELGRVLASAEFHGSKRAQRLLRHLVEHTVAGDVDALKERTLGVELFGREAAYDTGQDSIVRVAANDVRKRLGEHYDHSGAAGMRIGLPAGSYVPEFQMCEGVPPAPAVRARLRVAIACVLALLAAGVLARQIFVHAGSRDALGEFWSPVLKNPRPVMICVAQPLVYRLPDQPSEDRFGAEEPAAGPARRAPMAELIPMPDAFVGVGDASALASLASFFGSRGKPWQVRAGAGASAEELRAGPVVLIGAYTNPWTRKLTQNLRFVFEAGTFIREQTARGRRWGLPKLTLDWKTPEDFAILSRFSSPETGEPVIVAAGLTNYGTHAAGEFLTDAALLESGLRQAPPGWPRKNLQFVIHTRILGNTPGRPTLVATHFW